MSDIWAPDLDHATGQIEDQLTQTLSTYLYNVHREAHLTLGLPQVPQRAVIDAHPAASFAKADGVSTAQRLFEDLLARPRQARRAEDMAELLTHHWYEQGHIEDEMQRQMVAANARGRIMAAQQGTPAPAYAVADPDDLDWRAIHYAQEHACIHLRKIKDKTRSTLAAAVVDALMRGDSPQRLASDLVQQFGVLNRDARRLAITEIAFARNNGYLSGVPIGSEVEVFTAKNCCAKCEGLTGRRYRVVSGPGDPESEVWVGKHNIGLPADQRTAALPFHPHCRCRWVKAELPAPGVDPRLKALLDSLA